jgi:hypothetical protein
MPIKRLERTRASYLCDMCGHNSLVGRHIRTVDLDTGAVWEQCSKRLYAEFAMRPADTDGEPGYGAGI